MLAIRWQSLPAGARPENAIREVKVVPLAKLKQALPQETVFVTPAQRKSQRAERLASYQRRLTQ